MSGLFYCRLSGGTNFEETFYKYMKGLIGLIVIITSLSATAQSSLSKLEWLLGNWVRTNAKPGRSGVEIWKKSSDQEFVGRGINLRGADTTFVEKLKIISKENKIFYVADVPENKEPILFEATSIAPNAVTFENPKHDFPKKIVYELTGSTLKATISGDGKAIEYWFKKE